MTRNALLVVISLVLTLGAAEVGLRVMWPALGSDRTATRVPGDSTFVFSERVGYELRPAGLLPWGERLNSEGFRGPEYALPTPPAVPRLATVGNSVVQGGAPFEQSWQQMLRRALDSAASAERMAMSYEVLNAGVQGHLAWQTRVRLADRVLKYAPDVVIVFVGWNDLAVSSLPGWTPEIDLSDFEEAYSAPRVTEPASRWGRVKRGAYRVSYSARLVRQVRNAMWNRQRIAGLIRAHRAPSSLPFNERAVNVYLEHLAAMHREVTATGARFAVVTWPTVMSESDVAEGLVERELTLMYTVSALSAVELWSWYTRWIDAQRRFVADRPGVLLIDAAGAFQSLPTPTRRRSFTDHAHLTEEGRELLARIVFDALRSVAWHGETPDARCTRLTLTTGGVGCRSE